MKHFIFKWIQNKAYVRILNALEFPEKSPRRTQLTNQGSFVIFLIHNIQLGQGREHDGVGSGKAEVLDVELGHIDESAKNLDTRYKFEASSSLTELLSNSTLYLRTGKSLSGVLNVMWRKAILLLAGLF